MAATGDGTGGRTITSTTDYQTLYDGTSADGSPVRAYTVQPKGEDAVVRVTYTDGKVRVYGVPNGETFTAATVQNGGRITKVEAKGESGSGAAIYGNVLVP